MGARVLASILAVFVAVAVLVGGYLGGWWVREDSVDRRAQINERTFARQTALQDELLNLNRDVANIDVQLTTATDGQKPALQAQRRAVTDRLCDAYYRMTDTVTVPGNVLATVNQECQP